MGLLSHSPILIAFFYWPGCRLFGWGCCWVLFWRDGDGHWRGQSPGGDCVLFAFSPNLLANFSLATTDGPLTATYVMAVFTWYWYGKRPSPWTLVPCRCHVGAGLGEQVNGRSPSAHPFALCFTAAGGGVVVAGFALAAFAVGRSGVLGVVWV